MFDSVSCGPKYSCDLSLSSSSEVEFIGLRESDAKYRGARERSQVYVVVAPECSSMLTGHDFRRVSRQNIERVGGLKSELWTNFEI